MSVKELDTQKSTTPWWVFKDVASQNAKYGPTYTAKQKAAADTFADCIKMAYAGNVYINYRKKFIAVKLENGIVRDKGYARMVAQIVEERNYEKVETAQGDIYRISR